MISKQNQPLYVGLQTNKAKSKHNAYKRHSSKLDGKKYTEIYNFWKEQKKKYI